jgi:hypothetical protein
VLTPSEADALAASLLKVRDSESPRLERLLAYRRTGVGPGGVFSDGRLSGLPVGVPDDVKSLAKISRVNLLRYVVASRVQDMYVEGFQTRTSPDNVEGWDAWQANGMDARQMGVHRAALTFGSSYVVVLPGDPTPVIRGVSPRDLTVGYGDDDVWPVAGLWRMPSGRWRLIDSTSVYDMAKGDDGALHVTWSWDHEIGVTPIVRFRDTVDVDVDVEGIVEPMIALQDQINITSFGLQVAQHYGAFRQRYIIGWLADAEAEALKTSAARLMMFEDSPDEVKVGEFSQTELRGYIESREASIRHLATVSQTPVHELMGQFVNLSAEALEAAKASHHAGVEENRISAGESWEQVLSLASLMMDAPVEESASVVWRDTTMRSLGEAANALGLMAEKLGVPKTALWPRIPGVSQHELEQWKAMAADPGAYDELVSLLGGQSAPAVG